MNDKKFEYSIFLKKLRLTDDVRNLKQGLEIEFDSPITLLVGDIGVGKSTLLDLIRSQYNIDSGSYMKQDMDKHLEVEDTGFITENIRYYDFHSQDMKYSGSFGSDMGSQLQAMWQSSGQGALSQFAATGLQHTRESLIILDEIGRGASPKLKYRFRDFLAKMAIMKNQVIASTHSVEIMNMAGLDICKLYSVEHLQYMTLDAFLDAHLKLDKK